MAFPNYVYDATVVSVHDGDTATLDCDLGFYVTVRMSCRLSGINARELSSPGGPEARDHLAALIPPGTPVTVASVAVDKFGGRFDGIITIDGAQGSVNDRMVADGYAAIWDGRGKRATPPWPLP